jgi:hypothetical protein
MTGYRFGPSTSLLKTSGACALLSLCLAAADVTAAVRTTFTGTFDVPIGSDDAGLVGATLEFVTTTDEIWGSSPVDPSVAILSATATITGSVANDGIFSTQTANPYWIRQFPVTFDADLNSASIDFGLPDSDLLQISLLVRQTATPPVAGAPVVPENWGSVIFASAITGEVPGEVAGNFYQFSNISFTLTDLIDIDIRDAINLSSDGLLSVTVPSTSGFDAQLVDADTLLFGDPVLEGTHVAPTQSSLEDATEDGLTDLVLKFSIPDLVAAGALDANSMEAQLSGSTLGGTAILGSDTFGIVPLSSPTAVPEPSCLVLAVACLLGLLIRRSGNAAH